MPRKKKTNTRRSVKPSTKKRATRARARKTIPRSKPKAKKGKGEKLAQSVKGFRDILPPEMQAWDFIEKHIRKQIEPFGFRRIGLPVLEKSELFRKSTGEDTDIVQKEMFAFKTKGGEEVSLIPEATPNIARVYVEHGMHNLAQPVKMYYYGPLFRYERPQAGRYRQFHQLSLEALGSEHPALDAQIIFISAKLLDRLGIKDYDIHINSIGCVECRKDYKEVLIDYFTPKKRQLCDNCKKRLRGSPLRVLDCKKDKCKQISASAPPIVDYLCEGCDEHFKRVLEYLDEVEIPYSLNTNLVRGLDYYNRTTFEVLPKNKDKAQNAYAGGGRYDKLVKSIGGRETPGLGVAFGIERLIETIIENDNLIKKQKAPDVLLIQLGELAKKKGLKLFDDLINSNISIREALHKDSIKSQLRLADKLGVKFSLILGQKEAQEDMILVRNMKDGVQELIKQSKLVEEIKKRIKNFSKN